MVVAQINRYRVPTWAQNKTVETAPAITLPQRKSKIPAVNLARRRSHFKFKLLLAFAYRLTRGPSGLVVEYYPLRKSKARR
jgi:hypothetical protein